MLCRRSGGEVCLLQCQSDDYHDYHDDHYHIDDDSCSMRLSSKFYDYFRTDDDLHHNSIPLRLPTARLLWSGWGVYRYFMRFAE
jgi:hypothetical protein